MEEPRPGVDGSLFPDRTSPVPLSRQLLQRLRQAIRSGALAPGSRLLPTREFAARLGVSRNTVVAVTDQLISEGYLVARVGSGTFVARGLEAASAPRSMVRLELPPSAQHYLTIAGDMPNYGGKLIPFLPGVPDIAAFPLAAWDRLARRLRSHPNRFGYGDPSGVARLRIVLADHLRQFRGLSVTSDDIVIVEGAQAAITLIANVMLEPGEPVLLEDPCCAAARVAFAAHGASIVSTPTDEIGLRGEGAPAARLAFVTPSHQYPLGGTMTPDRRSALFTWARTHDAYIVEDDYDGEFRFHSRSLPALQSADADSRVIYVGTFSKALAPGLRIGYVVAPPHLAPAFRAARAASSLGADPHTQRILAEFIAEGCLARHVRRMTGEYQRRAELLARLLAPLSDRLRIGPVTGAIHLTVIGGPGLDDRAIARAAYERGVFLHPISADCDVRTDLRGFALGFGAAPCDMIPDAVERFREVLDESALHSRRVTAVGTAC
jgi:GntR family transcriptional regulator / MocR family aminotransferase